MTIEMNRPTIDMAEGLLVIGFSIFILICPQFLTKKNLGSEENGALKKKLKKAAWVALACGVVFTLIGIRGVVLNK